MSKYKKMFDETINSKYSNKSISVMKLENELKNKFKSLENIELYIDNDGYLYLADIRVYNNFRGNHVGTEVMKVITQFADEHKLTMKLIPVPDEGSVRKLINFYKKFGFLTKKEKPFGYSMYRLPKNNV